MSLENQINVSVLVLVVFLAFCSPESFLIFIISPCCSRVASEDQWILPFSPPSVVHPLVQTPTFLLLFPSFMGGPLVPFFLSTSVSLLVRSHTIWPSIRGCVWNIKNIWSASFKILSGEISCYKMSMSIVPRGVEVIKTICKRATDKYAETSTDKAGMLRV